MDLNRHAKFPTLEVTPLSQSISEKLWAAVESQRNGDFLEAELLYRSILEEDPDHPETNHNLGTLAFRMGKSALGLQYLEKAVSVSPGFSPFWTSYATALVSAGRDHDALQLLDRARAAGVDDQRLDSIRQQITEHDKALTMGSQGILSILSANAAGSAGSSLALTKLALQDAGQIFPLLALVTRLSENRRALAQSLLSPKVTDISSIKGNNENQVHLSFLFNKYKSDKSSAHDYHILYSKALSNPEKITAVLEIGLGTNNDDVVSSMGASGCPGASLRAFRDYLPNAAIYGADIDRRILFEEDRIRTFHIDQTDLRTFAGLAKSLGNEMFDLIIDDGLHSPAANIATMLFAVERLKPGGWFVVEDITAKALPVWEVVKALMPQGLKTQLIRAKGGYMFAIQNVAADPPALSD